MPLNRCVLLLVTLLATGAATVCWGADEMPVDDVIGFSHNGMPYAIYRLSDGYYATANKCSHQGALLSKGLVIDGQVECPAHQGRFDDAERGIRRLAEIAEDYDFAPARQNHGAASTFFYLERGELQEAHVAATAYTTTMDEDPPRIFALGLDAKILIRRGELEGAEERIERAEALVEQIGIVPLFQMSTLRGARFMLDLDRLERATADGDGAGVEGQAPARCRRRGRGRPRRRNPLSGIGMKHVVGVADAHGWL